MDGRGAVVRHIEFERQPIFSQKDRDRFPWLPLSWVDKLHVDTRIRVLRRELLFSEGDRVRQADLEESARKLRQTGFFSEASLLVHEAPGDSVDIRVVTRELWTTDAEFSYETYEEQKLWSVRFRERNFLGTARTLDFSRSRDLDRSSWSLGAGDRQLFDGRWRAVVERSSADDGGSFSWSLSRPFFRLAGRQRFSVKYSHAGTSPRYYLTRGHYFRPHLDSTEIEFGYQHRWILRPQDVWRWGLFFRVQHQRLESGPVLSIYDPSGFTGENAVLGPDPPENRRWHTPLLGIQRRTRRFAQTQYLFAMGRDEDIPLGSDFDLQLGWTSRSLGSTESGLAFVLKESFFRRHPGNAFDRLKVDAEGLFRYGDVANASVRAQVSTYRPLGPGSMFAASVLAAAGTGLDRHRIFHLGLESGLRAARFRELSGDRLLRGNAELRWVYRPGLWSFLAPGVAAFGDIGTAWIEGERDLSFADLRGALGVGLRIGFSRAANAVPIRVDLAWPVLYPSQQSSPILSIGTGHVF